MTEHSKKLNKDAEDFIIKKYGLSRTEVRKEMQLFADYIYGTINKIDLAKPLRDQPNCINITSMGYLRVRMGLMVKEQLEDGVLPIRYHDHAKRWFSIVLNSKIITETFKTLKQYRHDKISRNENPDKGN
jgi:hypothetical protein